MSMAAPNTPAEVPAVVMSASQAPVIADESGLWPRFGRLFSKLKRVTSGGGFIPEVDGLRLVAIASVFMYHVNGDVSKVIGSRFAGQLEHNLLSRIFQAGNFGVQLFFVISGFILGLPFIRASVENSPRPALGVYYFRRLMRIEPPLIINLTLYLVILHVVKHVTWAELLQHYTASMLYFHNLVYKSISTINFVTWSLEVEAQFYLTAPFLAAILSVPGRGLRWRTVTVLIAICAVGSYYGERYFNLISLTLAGQLAYFLGGFLLAALYLEYEKRGVARLLAWDGVAALSWAALVCLNMSYSPWSAIAKPYVVCLAYISSFQGLISNAILTWPVLTAIGGMCYTIYLYHSFMISLFGRATFRMALNGGYELIVLVQIFLLAPLVVVSSAVLYLLLEKPFMNRVWPTAMRDSVRKLFKAPLAKDI
jgi:peptidoglycan/LPS O-acetylase OafA/YrhL